MTTIRLSVPDTAKKGETIEVKAMIQHPMETGYRRGMKGEVIERDIIRLFECRYNDELVFSGEYFPGIAANPFITFHVRASETGDISLKWTDQSGQSWSETARLTVS